MSWVWEHSRSKPTARLVLLAIADCANDQGREAYPSNATLMRKTGLSERGVRQAITDLDRLGELSVEYKSGPRGCNRYRINMHPAQRAGYDQTRQDVPGTRHDMPGERESDPAPHAGDPAPHAGDPAPHAGDPAGDAPEPSENRQRTVREPSGARKRADADKARGSRLPDGWEPDPELIDWARTNAPSCGRADHEAFVDYWHSVPGQRGRKVDWRATWRNWMRTEQQKRSRHQPSANGHQPQMGTTERKMRAALEAGRQAQALYDQQQQRLEIAS